MRQLRSLQVETRAVILPESRDRDPAIDTFRCGARGVIARDEPLTTLNKCIRVFDPGQIWVSTQHLDYLLEARGKSLPLRLQNARGIEILSKREADVIHPVAQGLTNREVSSQLNLSEHTVHNYLFRVFDKLGVPPPCSWLFTTYRKANSSQWLRRCASIQPRLSEARLQQSPIKFVDQASGERGELPLRSKIAADLRYREETGTNCLSRM